MTTTDIGSLFFQNIEKENIANLGHMLKNCEIGISTLKNDERELPLQDAIRTNKAKACEFLIESGCATWWCQTEKATRCCTRLSYNCCCGKNSTIL